MSGDELTAEPEATAGLSVEARAVLHAAAVIGPEFDLDVLEEVARLDADELRSALQEAEQAEIVKPAGDHYAFAEALVRAAVVDEIPPPRQARLHGRAGDAIERLRADDLGPHLDALARHLALAGDQPERALDFTIQAARQADDRHAWDEAAEHYRTALRIRELTGLRGDRIQCDLLLALGFSQSHAGSDEAPDSFAAAGECARALGDPELIARAALGMGASRGANAEDAEWLETALIGLGRDETPLRARVMAQLSLELPSAADAERRAALTAEAVDLARRTEQMKTLAACLDAHHLALWRPERVQERLAVAAEMCAVGEQLGDPGVLYDGYAWTVVDLLELGDVAGVDRQIEAAAARGAHWWTSLARGMRALLAGDLAAAERLAGEALALGREGRIAEAAEAHAQQLFAIRREQGRLGELESMVRDLAEADVVWGAALALLLVETGREQDARAAYEQVLGDRLDTMPDYAERITAVALLAEVCAAVGDVEGAGRLYPQLESHHRRVLVVGRGAATLGCASRLTGALAATARDWDLARTNYEEALLMHEAMGARPWAARTQLALAAVADRAHERGGETVRPEA